MQLWFDLCSFLGCLMLLNGWFTLEFLELWLIGLYDVPVSDLWFYLVWMFLFGFIVGLFCDCVVCLRWTAFVFSGCVTFIDCLIYKGLLQMIVGDFCWWDLLKVVVQRLRGLLRGFVVCDYLWVAWWFRLDFGFIVWVFLNYFVV